MTKLIIEMEMPKRCGDCLLCETVYMDFEYCKLFCLAQDRKEIITEGIPIWCPIKGVLPNGHGDLIDRDELLYVKDEYGKDVLCVSKNTIANMPALIAAERKDDEQG